MQNFKQYSVIIDGGTGVLFQPMTSEYFYVLTAKHVVQNKVETTYVDKEEESEITINRFIKDGNNWSTVLIPFKINKGSNYFPHKNSKVDAAILKISFEEVGHFDILNLSTLNFTNINNDASLCGFPSDKRKASHDDLTAQYTNYKISENSNDTQYNCSVRLQQIQTQDTIGGMSGGGIVRLIDNYYQLIGIQSQMTQTVSEQNEIDFVPIKRFDDIIKYPENKDKLSPLLPPYMGAFEYLKDKAFDINAGPDDSDIIFTRSFLQNKTKEVIASNITPSYIRNFFKERLLLNENNLSKLNNELIYITWLEFLTIVNIVKSKKHEVSDLEDLFNAIRLICTNTDTDWLATDFLEECAKCDFEDLKEGGTVLIKTNKNPINPKIDHYRIKRNSILPNIQHIKSKHENGQLGDIFIGDASSHTKEFVFTKFNFMHFEFLKAYMLVWKSEDYKGFNVNNQTELLTKLKEEYGKLFNI